jgi:hypothetical protein
MLPAQAADSLPPPSTYLGEIRRDASGKLIAVPRPISEEAQPEGEKIAPPSTKESANSQSAQSRDSTPSARRASASKASDGHAARGAESLTERFQEPKTIRVGPNQAVRSISVAAKMAKSDDTIEIETGDYVADVAVWKQERITIRGVGGRPRLIAAGASAEQKAIWVIRGGAITVENIEFRDARVRDRNGAGIRFEKGNLVVRNCRFLNNENGLLVGGGAMSLTIENSEFGYNGAGDGQSHNIYVGAIDKLHVSGSYFHHANVGHLLKSRARTNYIFYNRLTDETGGRASYELEFPSGGVAVVVANIIEQSSTTENSGIISFGAEGYRSPRNELYLVHNTIINDRTEGGRFLAVKAGDVKVSAVSNLLMGKGDLESGIKQSFTVQAKAMAKELFGNAQALSQVRGTFSANVNVNLDAFMQASRYDYRTKKNSGLRSKLVDSGWVDSLSLTPAREYVHPASSMPLESPPTLPGAIQSVGP